MISAENSWSSTTLSQDTDRRKCGVVEEMRPYRPVQSMVFLERARYEISQWNREQESHAVIHVVTRAQQQTYDERISRTPSELLQSNEEISVHYDFLSDCTHGGHEEGFD